MLQAHANPTGAVEQLDRGNDVEGLPAELEALAERFAAALARVHEAADAARLAARRCDRASDAVGVLLQPSRRR